MIELKINHSLTKYLLFSGCNPANGYAKTLMGIMGIMGIMGTMHVNKKGK